MDLARPPLSAVCVPREEIGKVSFEAIDRMLKLKRYKGTEFRFDTELVVRKSTAPVRRHELCLTTLPIATTTKWAENSGSSPLLGVLTQFDRRLAGAKPFHGARGAFSLCPLLEKLC